MTRRYRREHTYKTHTAKTLQRCAICGGDIAPGDIYLRRELYREGRHVGALLKCDQCVTIREINNSE